MNIDAIHGPVAAHQAAVAHPLHAEPGSRGVYSAMSLEMCRPLISLRAGFDLLLAGCEGPISPEQRGHVQALRAQCDDLLRLTRSYLDYAELACGPRELGRDSYRLGALLDESDRQFAGMAAGRGTAWACRLVGDDATVMTDLAGFQQVIGELVANAFASTSGGGRVELVGRVEPGAWFVEVADDGRGIPPEVIDQIFEPLVRLPQPGHCPGDGHGMGLAVCRELVARLGGRIELRSEVGRGTTAILRFPAESAAATARDKFCPDLEAKERAIP